MEVANQKVVKASIGPKLYQLLSCHQFLLGAYWFQLGWNIRC